MQLTSEQRRKKILWEIKDLLTGAAFPLMLQLVFSASVILFSDTDEFALAAVILCFGELLVGAAYFICGRQNGVTAYRRTMQNEKKRAIGSSELKAVLRTGEYALYKGFLIGFISCVPYIIFQFIECLAHNSFCAFLLKYAFGWAAYPFNLIGRSTGELSPWLNFIWVIFPVCVHALAYFLGGRKEAARQEIVAQAQESRDKHRK
ncbi:MAG: hypothetical protein K2G38_06625 [Clostridia bacterium]|nr:hypothetical protein [Clostridia bacterium]